jgi:hypothetical protein
LIQVRWYDDDKTIILYQIEDDWSVADFFASSLQIDRMIDTVDHVVDIIGVFHRANMPSGDFIDDAGSVPFRKRHSRRGKEFFVGMNYFLNTMALTLQKTYPGKYDLALAPTIEEAHRRILDLQKKRSKKPKP